MDVVALGELLIDFTENGTSAQDNKLFEANPGGAPCNVLAMLQKLGHQTAFIGKVGQDAFGRLLVDAVKEQGIDTTGVRYDDNVHTTPSSRLLQVAALGTALSSRIKSTVQPPISTRSTEGSSFKYSG